MTPEARNDDLLSEQGETRGSVRVGSDIPVDLHLAGMTSTIPARSRDVSVGGICLATASPFVLKDVRRVTLGLQTGPLTIDAHGCWQFDGSSDEVVLSGLSFPDPSQTAIDSLTELVQDSGRLLARFLQSQSDLRDLGYDEILGMAQVTRFRDVNAGHYIFQQDTSRIGEDSVFIVARGGVLLQVRSGRSAQQTLAQLRPGQLFGGLPLIADMPHTESAVAESDSRVLEISRDVFRYLGRARPWLAHRLASAIVRIHARRLHEMLLRARQAH